MTDDLKVYIEDAEEFYQDHIAWQFGSEPDRKESLIENLCLLMYHRERDGAQRRAMKNTCQTCGSVYEGDMCYTCCVVRLSPEEIELDRLRSELSMLREERDAAVAQAALEARRKQFMLDIYKVLEERMEEMRYQLKLAEQALTTSEGIAGSNN